MRFHDSLVRYALVLIIVSVARLDAPVWAMLAVVYTAAMGACGAAGRWEEAVALLDEMETVQVRRRFKKTRARAVVRRVGKNDERSY